MSDSSSISKSSILNKVVNQFNDITIRFKELEKKIEEINEFYTNHLEPSFNLFQSYYIIIYFNFIIKFNHIYIYRGPKK